MRQQCCQALFAFFAVSGMFVAYKSSSELSPPFSPAPTLQQDVIAKSWDAELPTRYTQLVQRSSGSGDAPIFPPALGNAHLHTCVMAVRCRAQSAHTAIFMIIIFRFGWRVPPASS